MIIRFDELSHFKIMNDDVLWSGNFKVTQLIKSACRGCLCFATKFCNMFGGAGCNIHNNRRLLSFFFKQRMKMILQRQVFWPVTFLIDAKHRVSTFVAGRFAEKWRAVVSLKFYIAENCCKILGVTINRFGELGHFNIFFFYALWPKNFQMIQLIKSVCKGCLCFAIKFCNMFGASGWNTLVNWRLQSGV